MPSLPAKCRTDPASSKIAIELQRLSLMQATTFVEAAHAYLVA